MVAKPAVVRVKRRRQDPAPEDLGMGVVPLLPLLSTYGPNCDSR